MEASLIKQQQQQQQQKREKKQRKIEDISNYFLDSLINLK